MKKTNKKLFFTVLLLGFVLIFSNSCKKDDSSNASTAITDYDGNVYHSITIGTQIWMVENLKTTHYNDGTAIPNVTDNTWGSLTTPALCWYSNNAINKDPYGALYNWYAASNSKLCPTGWHVPTANEWATLITSLGGESVAGGKLKEAGTAHWKTTITGVDNSSGFTALPGGCHNTDNIFYAIETYGWWWSSMESSSTEAWHIYLQNTTTAVTSTSGSKSLGFSVRCIKD